jgi:metal-responsive CopG/Arc/MetJ family transcriptional regulator
MLETNPYVEGKIVTTIAIERDLYDRLSAHCAANKVKRTAFIRQAINKLLDELKQ